MNNYGNKSMTVEFNGCVNTLIDDNQDISFLIPVFQIDRENFPQVANMWEYSYDINLDESTKVYYMEDSPQFGNIEEYQWNNNIETYLQVGTIEKSSQANDMDEQLQAYNMEQSQQFCNKEEDL